MEAIKTIIVDDEAFAIKVLEVILKRNKNINLVNTFQCPLKALTFIDANKIDLVFLDMQMPNFTGLDFLKELNKLNYCTKIIVTTSNSDYAFNVINDKRVLYFIKKPIHEYTVNKAVKDILLSEEKDAILDQKNDNSHTFFNCERRMINIAHDDINLIKSSKGGIEIITSKGPIFSNTTLSKTEKKLPTDTFFRIHKSYIVNIKKVEMVFDNLVILEKLHAPIGRVYSSKIKQVLKEA